MSDPPQKKYLMSFGVGGLLLTESVSVARIHVEGEAWEQTMLRALDQGATSLPKTASNRRTLREITNRLRTLSAQERAFLLDEADRTDQQALLWLSSCRAYRFVREFALEVIRERYLSYQIDLPLEAFDILFEAKAEWDDGLADLSTSTRKKLRQVLVRMMREAGILSGENRIQTAILSQRLIAMIEDKNPVELALFPGVKSDGE
ncbi:MAG: DUF1819 family protein [Sulfitobacter sp.]|uniref:DUF1819 family protein n=1 Tax=Alphaproteobacteria TaxID=28211 RepID=UPI00294391A5|nr:DUF1819 family protein [Sulfitobacter sp. LC.270.F.C4]WOI14884.1 DUF1819 family protein [Sulfitobacter sp. LC.270.F.C4]